MSTMMGWEKQSHRNGWNIPNTFETVKRLKMHSVGQNASGPNQIESVLWKQMLSSLQVEC